MARDARRARMGHGQAGVVRAAGDRRGSLGQGTVYVGLARLATLGDGGMAGAGI